MLLTLQVFIVDTNAGMPFKIKHSQHHNSAVTLATINNFLNINFRDFYYLDEYWHKLYRRNRGQR